MSIPRRTCGYSGRREVRQRSALPSLLSPYRAILGSKLSALWDARLGIALGAVGRVDTWTDQVQGIVAQAPSATERPQFAQDVVTANFKGRELVLSSATTSRRLIYQGAAIAGLGAGIRPMCWMVTRFPAYSLAVNRWSLRVTDNPITAAYLGFLETAGGDLMGESPLSASVAAYSSMLPTLLKAGLDSAGTGFLANETGVLATSGSGGSTSVAAATVVIGGNQPAASSQTAYIGQIGICNAPLTAAEDAALTAYVRQDWGF